MCQEVKIQLWNLQEATKPDLGILANLGTPSLDGQLRGVPVTMLDTGRQPACLVWW